MPVSNLDDLCDLIREHREMAEDSARLAPEVLRAGGSAGLWTLAAPVEVGGHELPFAELFSVLERLGQADVTVAWHAVNSGSIGHAAGRLPEAVRAKVFARTDRPYGFSGAAAAGVEVSREEGGFRLEGTWPFMTGALDAGWATVAAIAPPVTENAANSPDVRRMVISLADCEVSNSWNQASAMRGTGSHAVSAPGIFVPEERTIRADSPLLLDRPAFRCPSQVPFIGCAGAMSIGVLRSALEGAVELCATKRSRYDGHKHFDDPRLQQYVADASAAADSLSANLRENGERLWAVYDASLEPDHQTSARFWSAVFYTVDTAADHVSRLYRVATSATYGTRNKVERALRDIHAVNAAVDSFQAVRRAAGGILLGQEPNHPLFR